MDCLCVFLILGGMLKGPLAAQAVDATGSAANDQQAAPSLPGQNTPAPTPTAPPAPSVPGNASGAPNPLASVARQVIRDQKDFLASPRSFTPRDLEWLLPAIGGAAFLIETDSRVMREGFHSNALARSRSANFSDAGLAALVAIPALLEWHGWRQNDDYAQRTALMAARSTIDALIATEGLKLIFRRDRPLVANGSGEFFRSNPIDGSIPSMHSSTAWALASVVARRYRNPYAQAAVYSMAAAVSLSRITAEQHFPADVVLGGALGWAIGRYVSR